MSFISIFVIKLLRPVTMDRLTSTIILGADVTTGTDYEPVLIKYAVDFLSQFSFSGIITDAKNLAEGSYALIGTDVYYGERVLVPGWIKNGYAVETVKIGVLECLQYDYSADSRYEKLNNDYNALLENDKLLNSECKHLIATIENMREASNRDLIMICKLNRDLTRAQLGDQNAQAATTNKIVTAHKDLIAELKNFCLSDLKPAR